MRVLRASKVCSLRSVIVVFDCTSSRLACEIRLKMSSRDPASDQLVNYKKRQVSKTFVVAC